MSMWRHDMIWGRTRFPFVAGCLFGLIVGSVGLLLGAITPDGPRAGSEVFFALCLPMIWIITGMCHIPGVRTVLGLLLYFLFPLFNGLLYGGVVHGASVVVRRIARRIAPLPAARDGSTRA